MYAERAKGRILLEVMQAGKVNVNGVMTPEEREQERKLNGKIVSLNTRIYGEKVRKQIDVAALAELTAKLDKARLEYQTLMDGVYVAHPELRSRVPRTAALRMGQLRALTSDSDTAFLEFVVMDDRSYLFVISKNSPTHPGNGDIDIKSFEIQVKKADLKVLVETFRERLANPHFPAENLARKPYDLLARLSKRITREQDDTCCSSRWNTVGVTVPGSKTAAEPIPHRGSRPILCSVSECSCRDEQQEA